MKERDTVLKNWRNGIHERQNLKTHCKSSEVTKIGSKKISIKNGS